MRVNDIEKHMLPCSILSVKNGEKKVEERKLSGNQYLIIERYNQTLLPCSIRAVSVNNSRWRLAIWSVNYRTRHLLLYSIWPVPRPQPALILSLTPGRMINEWSGQTRAACHMCYIVCDRQNFCLGPGYLTNEWSGHTHYAVSYLVCHRQQFSWRLMWSISELGRHLVTCYIWSVTL